MILFYVYVKLNHHSFMSKVASLIRVGNNIVFTFIDTLYMLSQPVELSRFDHEDMSFM